MGVATNIPYLREILELPAFKEGNLDTGFLDRYPITPREPLEQQKRAAAIAAVLHATGQPSAQASLPSANGSRASGAGWRSRMGWQYTQRAMGRWPKSI